MAQLVGNWFTELAPELRECLPALDEAFRNRKAGHHAGRQLFRAQPSFWTYTMWPVMVDQDTTGTVVQITENIQPHVNTLQMNEALVVGALRQHELAEAAEAANVQLQAEMRQREKVEQALFKNKQQYDHLVSKIPVGIYTMVTTPNGESTFNYVSTKFAEMWKTSPEKMLADSQIFLRSVHPEDLDAFSKKTGQGFTDRTPLDWQGRILGGENITWLHIVASSELLESGDVWWSGVVEDITERKHAEAERDRLEAENRQLQKAESLGRIAAAIAHIFNNELGVVIGNLELAFIELSNGAEPVEYLTKAVQAARKAAGVSTEMLAYLGQQFGQRQPIDLSELILTRLPALQAIIPAKVVFETHLASPGPIVMANREQLRQVLISLLTNACEAAEGESGAVQLRVKTIARTEISKGHCYPIQWQPENRPYACLELADLGCGIAVEDLENLFDPFFSRKFTGRGLGLAVVAGIVKAHGGVVTVESQVGRGSTFRVFLPMTNEVVNPPRTFVQPLAVARGNSVLLVEDEPMMRSVASAMLKRLGLTVLEASDGVEATALFRERRDEIGWVLCDLTMPRMDGWATLSALRKLAPDLPVILSSGYDKSLVMAEDRAERPQGFLGKPYTLKELKNALDQALASRANANGFASSDQTQVNNGSDNGSARQSDHPR